MTGIHMTLLMISAEDDVIPDALDWPNISGATFAVGANDQVTGITSNINLSWAISGYSGTNVSSATVQVIINGGTPITIWNNSTGINTSPTSVSNDANVSFSSSLSASNPTIDADSSGTITVRNQSNANTTLDSFTFFNLVTAF